MMLNTMRFSLLWSALAVLIVPPTEISIVDATNVPVLKPIAIEQAVSPQKVASEVAVRYGSLFASKPSFSYDSKHDFTATYKHLYPYPETRYVPIKPFNPLQKEPGIKRVEAFQRQWQRSENGYAVTEDILWQWEPPKELQNSWVVSTNHSPGDHYLATALLPLMWKIRNPVLCYFDAEKGLVWQKEIPLKEIYATVKGKVTMPPGTIETRWSNGSRESAVISKDGSRVVVIIPYEQPCLSLMFVYDNEGHLLKTQAFLERFAANNAFSNRTPRGDRFMLRLDHRYEAENETKRSVSHRNSEDYLVDFDGNLIQRFEEPRNGPDLEESRYAHPVASSDDKYVSIYDTVYSKQRIYALPK